MRRVMTASMTMRVLADLVRLSLLMMRRCTGLGKALGDVAQDVSLQS